MNAVYCVFLGAQGKAEVMDSCTGPVGQMLSREEEGLRCKSSCRTDAGHLLTSGANHRGRREPPVPHNFHGFTLCNGSWHHNYIIIARPHLFIQPGAAEWSERGSVWTLAQERHLVGLRWLIGLLICRVTAYSKLDIGRRDGCDAVCLMTVFNWSISMWSH